MTGIEFVQEVKAKINRIDTAAYEQVEIEEILLFGNDALKQLTLKLDRGILAQYATEPLVAVYLADLTKTSGEVALTGGATTLPDTVLRLKDVKVQAKVGNLTEWVDTRFVDNEQNTSRQSNVFTKSYPDCPSYRLIDNSIKFNTDDSFTCEKIKYEYLEFPAKITENSNFNYSFIKELQDDTVTLLLETLESRRLQSHSVVSKN